MTGHSAEVKIELITRNLRINLWGCGPNEIKFRDGTDIRSVPLGNSILVTWVDGHPISWTVEYYNYDEEQRTGWIRTKKYPANEASRGSEGERIPSSP